MTETIWLRRCDVCGVDTDARFAWIIISGPRDGQVLCQKCGSEWKNGDNESEGDDQDGKGPE